MEKNAIYFLNSFSLWSHINHVLLLSLYYVQIVTVIKLFGHISALQNTSLQIFKLLYLPLVAKHTNDYAEEIFSTANPCMKVRGKNEIICIPACFTASCLQKQEAEWAAGVEVHV